MLAFVFLLVATIASQVFGQAISLPSTAYRPGRYLPLRIEATAPGSVIVDGNGVQSIYWTAPGRSSVVVPLLVDESTDHLQLTVNNKPVTLESQPLNQGDTDPPEFTTFWNQHDPLPVAGPEVDPDAYALANLWQPSAPPAVRRRVLIATAVSVIVLGVARHGQPRRAGRWLATAAIVLVIFVIGFPPTEAIRRVLPADGRPGWEWVWYASEQGRVSEPWVPGLRYVRGVEDVKHQSAVLHCDAGGNPTELSVELMHAGRVVFLRPVVHAWCAGMLDK